MTRTSRPLRRRTGRYDERRTYLICSEGENTETWYFKGLRRELRAGTVRINILSGKGEPYGVVEKAIAEANQAAADGDAYDEVWVVFDVEAPQPHARLASALALAARHGIRCAVSNPCFEVFLLLHYEDLFAYLTTDEACRRLERHPCGYSPRGKLVNFEALRSGRANALSRAARLDRLHREKPVDARNPSTSVPSLVTALVAHNGPRSVR
ncbi:RloB family protein [Micromonospora sp. WMMD1128]|uniref:RloB family protein n=1 Tax=Micromonospora sp. WMMD1128 TaxID=3015150 RepID=UPI00248C83AC|nr:RloB family protein [Micromonospora sp. WMMD1128]WBB73322.1 RloB family protein [Micromonospora sp. WMMD1128]